MKATQTPDDRRSERPDHDHRPYKIPPLNAQSRHRAGSENEHGYDAKVGGIPDVPIMDAKHVLRGNGNQRAKGIRPEGGGTHQNANADASDVSTRKVRPLAQVNAGQYQLGEKASANCQQGTGVTLEDAVGELAYQQDASDEQGGGVAIGRAEEPLPRRLWLRRLRGANPVTHSASLTL